MYTAEPPSDDLGALESTADFARIERAIAFVRRHQREQPGLADLARHLGLSESHTQRLFCRWAGISPKRFLQFLTVEHAKRTMAHTAGLLEAALAAGLSGPGRLHDLFIGLEGMSPGEFKRAAAGLTVSYGMGDTPFGPALIVTSERGICHLSFVGADALPAALASLREFWPQASLRRDDWAASQMLRRVFARPPESAVRGLSLWVSGTNFQIQVWRALLQVPFAGLLSYRRLADMIGRPGAARAVGSAVARNPVAFLIPCHRVLRESGEFGAYHWGSERKAAICAWEASDRAGRGGAETRA